MRMRTLVEPSRCDYEIEIGRVSLPSCGPLLHIPVVLSGSTADTVHYPTPPVHSAQENSQRKYAYSVIFIDVLYPDCPSLGACCVCV